MPTKEAAELQHSREFVEEQDAAVMRQTPVAKGDFHISRRSTHPDLNLTKSDVKVTMKICSGSPARSVRNSHPMPFFTPDSGRTFLKADGAFDRSRDDFALATALAFYTNHHWPQFVDLFCRSAFYGAKP